MNAGKIVTGHEIADDRVNVVADRRSTGIHPKHTADLISELREAFTHMHRRALLRCVGGGTVGIEPSMHVESALMGLGNKKSQRIIARRPTLSASKVAAPRLDLRCVKSIPFWTHLQKDGIESGRLRCVEKANGLPLLRLHGQSRLGWKIDIVNGGDPSALKVGETRDRQGEKNKEDRYFCFHQ